MVNTNRFRCLVGELFPGSSPAIVFVKPKTLGSGMQQGLIPPMIRSTYPPHRLLGDRLVSDPTELRGDYLPADQLLAPYLRRSRQAGEAWIVTRVNLPMNYGVGFAERGTWFLHREDDIQRYAGAWTLSFDTTSGVIAAGRNAAGQPMPAGQLGLLTPVYSVGSFDPETLVRGTYDVRQLAALENVYPDARSWPMPTLRELWHHERNRRIRELSSLFENDRDRYVAAVREIVRWDEPAREQWGRYRDRVVLAFDQSGSRRFSLLVVENATPPEVFEIALSESGFGPSTGVAALVEGGSALGIGAIVDGQLLDASHAVEPVEYKRPAQGLFYILLRVDPAALPLVRGPGGVCLNLPIKSRPT